MKCVSVLRFLCSAFSALRCTGFSRSRRPVASLFIVLMSLKGSLFAAPCQESNCSSEDDDALTRLNLISCTQKTSCQAQVLKFSPFFYVELVLWLEPLFKMHVLWHNHLSFCLVYSNLEFYYVNSNESNSNFLSHLYDCIICFK